MTSRQNAPSLRMEEDEESGEGLATLIPDIRSTAKIVEVILQDIILIFFLQFQNVFG